MPAVVPNRHMADPKVSIVMVVCNGEAYLEAAIESIQRQSFDDFELIIVDDGSHDRTGSILNKQTDSRFVILANESRIGLARTFEMADSKARGSYIARMCPDDLSHPHRIQMQADYLDRHPDVALVGCHCHRIDKNGSLIKRFNRLDTPLESITQLQGDRLFVDGRIMFRRSAVCRTDHHDAVDKDTPCPECLPIGNTRIEAACLSESLYYRRTDDKNTLVRHPSAHETCTARPCSEKPNVKDSKRYERHRAVVLAHPEDEDALQAFFREAVASEKLVHAKSTLDALLRNNPQNYAIRRVLIGILVQMKNFQDAMDAIETLVAFSKPDNALIDAALGIRQQLGPRRVPDASSGQRRISLCMIVKNEVSILGPCLNSIKGCVDEIIVVDTGSTDRSADMARIYGASVYEHEWRNDFSDARNVSLDKAKGDWILVLDADEIMASRDQAAVIKLVKSDIERTKAYALTTRNYTNLMTAMAWQANQGCYREYEAGAGWFPTTKVRLFPNDGAIRFRYPVHELVDPAIREAGFEIITMPAPIHHYGTVNEGKNLIKARHYFDLGYVKLEQFGRDRAALRELAVQAGQLERWPEAIELWQRLLTLLPDFSEALTNLAGAYWQLGAYEKGLVFSRRAVRVDPALKEGHYNLAINHMMLGQLEEASAILRDTIQRHPTYRAAEFMLAVISSLNDDMWQAKNMFTTIARKMTRPTLIVAIGELMKRMSGSALEAHKHKIAIAAGVEMPAAEAK